MAEKQFVDGLRVKEKNENIPEWIKVRLLVNRLQLIEWLQNQTEKWIEIDVKESKVGKLYCEVNTWKPENSTPSESNNADSDVKVPF